MNIDCLGTTHADTFYGSVICTRLMHEKEIADEYEKNTGLVIVEEFERLKLNPEAIPGVLVASHGPFTWGPNALKAVENAKVLEEVARMNYFTLTLQPKIGAIQQTLLDKHYLRKHGAGAYYGQSQ